MRFTLLASLLTLGCIFSPAAPATAQSAEESPDSDSQQLAPGDDQPSQPIDLAAVRQSIVEKTNAFREEQGLAPVESDAALREAATEFAQFMAESLKYGHHADGRTPAQRAVAAGYEYCIVLENIAYRQQSRGLATVDLGSHFFEGWRDSPEHRENMLDPGVTQTGVGLAVSETGNSIFAVQMFGRPESAKLRIEVTNEADAPVQLVVESGSKSRSFELPPRSTLTLERCRSTRLSLDGSEQGQQVEESSKWVVQSEQNEPTLQRVGS